MLLSTPDTTINHRETFCQNFFRVKPYFDPTKRPEVGRVAKNGTQVRVLLLQNNMTQVEVKSSHPNNYLSKSKKVLGEKTTQVLSNC